MKNTPPSIRTLRGFTLIELLIVIAIIAVLVAMLLPVTDRIAEEGRATKCLGNMKQLVAARMTYSGENNGMTMPLRPPWPADPNGICTWRYYINQKYNVDPKTFLCPSAPNVGKETGGESWRTANSDLKSNYCQMGNLPWNYPVAMANVSNPATQLDLVETRDNYPDTQIFNWDTVWGDGHGILGYWHNSKLNCGYMDGHVERKKLGATATPICQWDTNKGLNDGKLSHGGEYSSMPAAYK